MSGAMMPPGGQPPQMGAPAAPNGAPAGPPGVPPGMVPNPAFAQWQQQSQRVSAIIAENAKRQQQFDAAVALIKKDGLHGFRLDIEADSTIAPDEQAEKMARIEFTQQIIPLLENVLPLSQGNPPMASLAKEITLFAVRGFRVARPLEEAIETAFDTIAGQPPNPNAGGKGKGGVQQNPQIEAAKVQADVHDTQVKAQTDQMAIAQKAQQAQMQAQSSAMRDAAEEQRSQAQLAIQAAELEQRGALERARIQRMAAQGATGLV